MSKDTIIISPSGNFYGSEQVLFDFLSHSKNSYTLYIPQQSKFLERLKEAKLHDRHSLKYFNSRRLYFLYLSVLFQLIFLGKKRVYINEGGHIKWAKLLAKLLPHKKFILHLRILEDVSPSRLGTSMANVEYIIISKFLEKEFNTDQPYHLVHDAYIFKSLSKPVWSQKMEVLKFGIIGRVALAKGLGELQELFTGLNEHPAAKQFEFHFYGDVMNTPQVEKILDHIRQLPAIKMFFHGFVDKQLIYKSIDAVLHLNKFEPLGRIYFEALEYEIPIIGFNSGGIGELSSLVGDTSTIIECTEDASWINVLIDRLDQLHKHYGAFQQQASTSKIKAKEIFSISNYVDQISLIINR